LIFKYFLTKTFTGFLSYIEYGMIKNNLVSKKIFFFYLVIFWQLIKGK